MRNTVFCSIIGGLVIAMRADAAPPQQFRADVQAGGSMLALSVPSRGVANAALVVAGPKNFRFEKTFLPNEPITVNLSQVKDPEGNAVPFQDGDYKWELRLTAGTPDRAALVSEAAATSVSAGSKTETRVTSGHLTVRGGSLTPVLEPSVRGTTPSASAPAPTGGSQTVSLAGRTPLTFFGDNLYMGGSGCFGCVNGDGELAPPELLLKGSDPYLTVHDTVANVRFRFSNFSTSTVMTLRLTDSNIGGTTTSPFKVEWNTPDNTLYLDKPGAVGIGTATPKAVSMDIYPTASGSAQVVFEGAGETYQLYNNGSYFGIGTFASGGCAFCITPTAQIGQTLNIDGGKVGIRTLFPTAPLDVRVNGTTDPVLNLQGANQTDSLSLKVVHPNAVIGFGLAGSPGAFFSTAVQHDAVVFSQPGRNLLLGSGGTELMRLNQSGTSSGAGPIPMYLQLANGAYCTTGGVWTNASSRAYKQDIEDLSGEEAMRTLDKLTPVTYAYKAAPDEHHVGFIAEDAPDLVATLDHKGMSAMDIVAVLTKVVQQQKSNLAVKDARIDALERRLDDVERLARTLAPPDGK